MMRSPVNNLPLSKRIGRCCDPVGRSSLPIECLRGTRFLPCRQNRSVTPCPRIETEVFISGRGTFSYSIELIRVGGVTVGEVVYGVIGAGGSRCIIPLPVYMVIKWVL